MGVRNLTLSMVVLVAFIQSINSQSPAQLFKVTFRDSGCRGTFDSSEFAKVDRMIEECYDLFKEPELYPESR